jgi:hypothetical protein
LHKMKKKEKEEQDLNEQLVKMVQWVEDWDTATTDNRKKAQKDRDFYDGIQWTSDEITELNKRGQPVITINRIAKKINSIVGNEIRSRIDPEALPRTPSKHSDAANAMTDALRYVADAQRFGKLRTRVHKNVSVEGCGGAVVEVENTGTDEQPTVDVMLRYVSWDRLIYDPHAREIDFSDAKFVGICLWMDVEDAKDRWEDKKDIVDSTLTTNANNNTLDDAPRVWGDPKRKRVKVIEMYYKKSGEWYKCTFVRGGFLDEPNPTGFLNEKERNVCPLIMTSGFIDKDNNRYGVVRNLISPQEEINKRRSKALHLLTLRQVKYESGAVENIQTAMTQLAKPDGAVEVKPNAMFEILQNQDMVQGQFQLLQEAKGEIDFVGPSEDNEQGASGRAILAKQRAMTIELEEVSDNIKEWSHDIFVAMWLRIRQFWKDEKWIRISDEKDPAGYRFVGLNKKMTLGQRVMEILQKGVEPANALNQVEPMAMEGFNKIVQQIIQQGQQPPQQGQPAPSPMDPMQAQQQALQVILQSPPMQQPWIGNSTNNLDIDIILTETPDTAVIEQEEFEKMASLAQNGIPIPPEVLIEASQLRNKKKLLDMLQQQNNPQMMQAQQMMQQAQMMVMQADAKLKDAQTLKAQADAQHVQAETQAIGPNLQMEQARAVKHAAQAGAIMAEANPQPNPGMVAAQQVSQMPVGQPPQQ